MCGIVGFMANGYQGQVDRTDFFGESLYADALRGHDSTGVFSVSPNGKEVDIYKRALSAYDFMNMKRYDSFSNKFSNSPFVIGHNRKATRGGVTNETAHPFSSKNIVMVHNGTLRNHRSFPQGNSFDVDSEALCHAMAELGAVEAFEKAEGAFAVVWYDIATQSLRMVRNKERPLHFAYCADHDSVLVASEPAMIMWIAFRNKIQISKIVPLKEGVILSFKTNSLDKPKAQKIELFTPTYGNANYARNTNNTVGRNRQLPGVAKPKNQPEVNKADTSGLNSSGNIVPFSAPCCTTHGRATEHRKKSSLRLKTYDLDYGDDVYFEAHSFEPYARSHGTEKGGVFTGIMGDDKISCEIQQQGFQEKNYDEGAWYVATVMGIRIGTTVDEDIIWVVNAEKVGFDDTDRPKDIPIASKERVDDAVEKAKQEIRDERKFTSTRADEAGTHADAIIILPATGNDKPTADEIAASILADQEAAAILTEVDKRKKRRMARVAGKRKYMGPMGILLSKASWRDRVRDGCRACHLAIPLSDHEDVVFLDAQSGGGTLCAGCADLYSSNHLKLLH